MTPEKQKKLARRLEDIARRIEQQHDASVHYALLENPRMSAKYPTTMEVSLGHFKTIADDLRGIVEEIAVCPFADLNYELALDEPCPVCGMTGNLWDDDRCID
jgi:hypothetical protein